MPEVAAPQPKETPAPRVAGNLVTSENRAEFMNERMRVVAPAPEPAPPPPEPAPAPEAKTADPAPAPKPEEIESTDPELTGIPKRISEITHQRNAAHE